MVNAVLKNLKEHGGFSLLAIKTYIAANYKLDAEKLSPFIRKYFNLAVSSGALTQPKAKGASGSFKLSVKSTDRATAGSATVKKAKAGKKAPAKWKGEKKLKAASAAKKLAAAKKPAAAKKTAKPKTPKPKKAAVKKAKTPKKIAAKKK